MVSAKSTDPQDMMVATNASLDSRKDFLERIPPITTTSSQKNDRRPTSPYTLQSFPSIQQNPTDETGMNFAPVATPKCLASTSVKNDENEEVVNTSETPADKEQAVGVVNDGILHVNLKIPMGLGVSDEQALNALVNSVKAQVMSATARAKQEEDTNGVKSSPTDEQYDVEEEGKIPDEKQICTMKVTRISSFEDSALEVVLSKDTESDSGENKDKKDSEIFNVASIMEDEEGNINFTVPEGFDSNDDVALNVLIDQLKSATSTPVAASGSKHIDEEDEEEEENQGDANSPLTIVVEEEDSKDHFDEGKSSNELGVKLNLLEQLNENSTKVFNSFVSILQKSSTVNPNTALLAIEAISPKIQNSGQTLKENPPFQDIGLEYTLSEHLEDSLTFTPRVEDARDEVPSARFAITPAHSEKPALKEIRDVEVSEQLEKYTLGSVPSEPHGRREDTSVDTREDMDEGQLEQLEKHTLGVALALLAPPEPSALYGKVDEVLLEQLEKHALGILKDPPARKIKNDATSVPSSSSEDIISTCTEPSCHSETPPHVQELILKEDFEADPSEIKSLSNPTIVPESQPASPKPLLNTEFSDLCDSPLDGEASPQKEEIESPLPSLPSSESKEGLQKTEKQAEESQTLCAPKTSIDAPQGEENAIPTPSLPSSESEELRKTEKQAEESPTLCAPKTTTDATASGISNVHNANEDNASKTEGSCHAQAVTSTDTSEVIAGIFKRIEDAKSGLLSGKLNVEEQIKTAQLIEQLASSAAAMRKLENALY